MGPYESDANDGDRAPLSGGTGGGERAGPRGQQQSRALQRYRANRRFFERYWVRIFGMTQADVSQLAQTIRVTSEARDLTAMAKDVIRARLEGGPQVTSGPASNGQMPGRTVRHWDPTETWWAGDRLIVIVPGREYPDRAHAPRVGEVLRVGETYVVVKVDGIATPQVYGLGVADGMTPDPAAEAEMASLAEREDLASQVDDVLWRFGPFVVSRLLHALEADDRFVELEGRWFLRELAERPRETEMAALARALFQGSAEPKSIAELLALMPSFQGDSAAARFGLLLELRARRDLFDRVGASSHPSWKLAAPPAMRLVASHAVYDPETYEILCMPGDTLSREIARRLWRAGLLHHALGTAETGPTGEDDATCTAPGAAAAPKASKRAESDRPKHNGNADPRRSWPRWLPFGPH